MKNQPVLLLTTVFSPKQLNELVHWVDRSLNPVHVKADSSLPSVIYSVSEMKGILSGISLANFFGTVTLGR